MNLRIIKTVISREYMTRVKKKSFLVTTFVVPILFAAMMVVIFYIMGSTKERIQDVAVVDQSGIVMPYLQSNERVTYTDFSTEDPETIKPCVYGDEVLPNRGDPSLQGKEVDSRKAVVNGTTAHVTAIFGMTLAGLVIKDIYSTVVK